MQCIYFMQWIPMGTEFVATTFVEKDRKSLKFLLEAIMSINSKCYNVRGVMMYKKCKSEWFTENTSLYVLVSLLWFYIIALGVFFKYRGNVFKGVGIGTLFHSHNYYVYLRERHSTKILSTMKCLSVPHWGRVTQLYESKLEHHWFKLIKQST